MRHHPVCYKVNKVQESTYKVHIYKTLLHSMFMLQPDYIEVTCDVSLNQGNTQIWRLRKRQITIALMMIR